MAKICPRCGVNELREVDVQNAFSRYNDMVICSACGEDEALRPMLTGEPPLPYEEWFCNTGKKLNLD